MNGKIDFLKLDLMDAVDLAIMIEDEAKERYEEFTTQVGSRYTGDAADVFFTMAKYELAHKEQLVAFRKKLFGVTPARMTRDMIWDVEAPSQSAPRTFMSSLQAMEVALEGELKAHEFYSQALNVVKDEAVRSLFEELRNEEIEHQNLLKKWMKSQKGNNGPDRGDGDTDEPPGL